MEIRHWKKIVGSEKSEIGSKNHEVRSDEVRASILKSLEEVSAIFEFLMMMVFFSAQFNRVSLNVKMSLHEGMGYWTNTQSINLIEKCLTDVEKSFLFLRDLFHYKLIKYSSVFRENRCPSPPKPAYGGNFCHEAVTLKIRSRSPKSNKLLILSNLYKLANLVTFHPMVHEVTCRQTLFGLILVD